MITVFERPQKNEDLSTTDYHLTPDQVNYIKSQQAKAKAKALVSDPTSPYYEPDPEKEEQHRVC